MFILRDNNGDGYSKATTLTYALMRPISRLLMRVFTTINYGVSVFEIRFTWHVGHFVRFFGAHSFRQERGFGEGDHVIHTFCWVGCSRHSISFSCTFSNKVACLNGGGGGVMICKSRGTVCFVFILWWDRACKRGDISLRLDHNFPRLSKVPSIVIRWPFSYLRTLLSLVVAYRTLLRKTCLQVKWTPSLRRVGRSMGLYLKG